MTSSGVGELTLPTEMSTEPMQNARNDTQDQDVHSRLDELEEDIDAVDRKHERRVDQTIKPPIEELQEDSDDAREERAELFQMVQDLQETVTELDQRIEDMAGLAEDQETNPQKRVSDLRQIMIRRAKARGDSDDYERTALWWEEVQDKFAELGHGEISKPDCYKAMNDLEEFPGFKEGTKSNRHGNEVKAIRLNMDELRAHSSSSNPTTSESMAGDETAANHPQKSTSD